MSWNYGYVSEIEYNHNYFREISPSSLRLALLNKGLDPFPNRPLRYLELGYGQGLSLALHAAATDGEYWGTDFNPTQAANARSLAASFPGNIKIFNDSFEEFAARPELPTFDVIALHGIWSWISDGNRKIVVDIIRKTLAVGGVLYISYNCTPGWSAAMPVRHLMTLHERFASQKDASMEKRVEEALLFSKKVAESGSIYFKENKQAADRLGALLQQNRRYLAHEYFNRDWDPMPFTDVAQMLEEAKLTYSASAHLLDHVDAVNLTAEAQKMLSGISHTILRESVRDFFVNTQFRKDIYVKGPTTLPKTAIEDKFREMRFVLLTHPDRIQLKIRGPLGEANLTPTVYQAVIGALAEKDYAGKTMHQLEADARLSTFSYRQLLESIYILCATGAAYPTQSDERIAQALPRTRALNHYIMERARYDGEICVLASPVLGAGMLVGRFEQLFLRSLLAGNASPVQWAADAWKILDREGQRVLKDGKALESAADNEAELLEKAKAFERQDLPILRALQIA